MLLSDPLMVWMGSRLTKQWQVSIDLFLGRYKTNMITRDFCLGLVMAMNSRTVVPSQCYIEEFQGGLLVS